MEKGSYALKFGTRQITIIGMLSAITVVLGATGYGFIPLPICKATIMHIPVIIGAIIEGPIVGVAIGLIFGIFSIIQNLMSPNILSFAFLNPLVSVLPRVLIGLVAYYCYKFTFGKNQILKIGIGAAMGSLTNTVGVLAMIYLIYAPRYAATKGVTVAAAAKLIFGVAFTNGIVEAMLAVMISVPVILAIKKMRKN
jgi:uncharacterized membrane protein